MCSFIFGKKLKAARQDFRSKYSDSTLSDCAFAISVLGSSNCMQVPIVVLLRTIVANDGGLPHNLLRGDQTTREIDPILGRTDFVGRLFGGADGFDSERFLIDLIFELRARTNLDIRLSPRLVRLARSL